MTILNRMKYESWKYLDGEINDEELCRAMIEILQDYLRRETPDHTITDVAEALARRAS